MSRQSSQGRFLVFELIFARAYIHTVTSVSSLLAFLNLIVSAQPGTSMHSLSQSSSCHCHICSCQFHLQLQDPPQEVLLQVKSISLHRWRSVPGKNVFLHSVTAGSCEVTAKQ